MQLGTNIWPGYESLHLGKKPGFLDQEQVRLLEYPSATETLRAFRNGPLDAASLTLDEALALYQDDIEIFIVLLHDISNSADVIMAKPGIADVESLKGKRVAVENNALGAFLITRALDIHNLNVDDITVVSSQVNEGVNLYQMDQIDAAVTYEPFRTQLKNLGAQEVFSSKDIPGEIVDVMVVRQSFVQRHPHVVQHLVDSWFLALEFMENNPHQAHTMLANRLGMSVDEIVAIYEAIFIPTIEQNIRLI